MSDYSYGYDKHNPKAIRRAKAQGRLTKQLSDTDEKRRKRRRRQAKAKEQKPDEKP